MRQRKVSAEFVINDIHLLYKPVFDIPLVLDIFRTLRPDLQGGQIGAEHVKVKKFWIYRLVKVGGKSEIVPFVMTDAIIPLAAR